MGPNIMKTSMNDIFADTCGWGHLIDPSQAYHTLAADIYRHIRQQGAKVVTTNYIITELVALMTSPLRLSRTVIIGFIESLKTSTYVEIVHIDSGIDEQAWQMLTSRQDKEWGLVDCASFVVMKQRGITRLLTTDHHFEQAGFVRLLK